MAILGLPAGTDWHEPFQALDASGDAIDLTGATLMHFVIWQGAYTAIFNLTTVAGITVLSAALGRALVSLTHVQTQSMAGVYGYEWYATLASGDREVLDRGELHITTSFVGV